MADWREINFGSLAIPLNGLRAHADLNHGQVVVPKHLKNHKEIEEDLSAALAAGKREDPNWLTGLDIAAEVNDENSPYHGRSAYQIFARAAGFESILTKTKGRFPFCPNQEIVDLEAPVKNLRDYAFKEHAGGLISLFPETVENRQLYTDQLSKGLETARRGGDLDTLSGTEALDEIGYGCDNTYALDLFWQSAFASAWIKPDPNKPTIPVLRPGVGQLADVAQPAGQGTAGTTPPGLPKPSPSPSPFSNYWGYSPFNLPGTQSPMFGVGGQGPLGQGPLWNPLGQQPGFPGMGGSYFPGTGYGSPVGLFDDSTQLARTAADVAFTGGGLYFQKGVIAEYEMIFNSVVEGKKLVRMNLVSVDRNPIVKGLPLEPLDQARVQQIGASGRQVPSEPLDVAEFQKNNPKMTTKARRQAEILYDRAVTKGQSTPTEISRTGVQRGWIKGAFSLRRLFGVGAAVGGIVDLVSRFTRKDSRGLDGPLTDAGMNPVGAKTAMLGAGFGLTAVTILTGGMALPVLIVVGALSAVGLGLETADVFAEADNELDEKFRRLDQGWNREPNIADPSPEKSNPARDQSPLLVNWIEWSNKSRRVDSYI